MARVSVIYASKHGQTQKIAQYIQKEIESAGHVCEISECDDQKDGLEKFQAVIVGAPVYAGRYPRQLRKWTRQNSAKLSRTPSAFYSVCLGVLHKDE